MTWLDSLSEIRSRQWSEAPKAEREEKAREVITISSYAAAAAAIVPIPFVDLALLVPIHSAMVMTVGHILGRRVNEAEAKRVVVELGAVAGVTFAGRAAISALKKLLLPGIGGAVAAPASFALTWGLGQVAVAYFENPELSRDDLKKVFDEAMREGRGLFSKEQLERFRKKGEKQPEEGGTERAGVRESKPRAGEPLRPKKRTL